MINYPNPDNVPIDVRNTILKYGYTYIVQEALRLLHNQIGKWYKEGLTLNQYNNLPQFVKNMISYQPQLTKNQWNWFLDNWWDGRQKTVVEDLLELRGVIKGYIIQYANQIHLEDIPDGS